MVEVAGVHDPYPVDVNVNVTLPAAISAPLGVYVAVVSEVGLANVPVPLVVQAVLAAFVALDPAVIATAPEFEHVLIAVPATAVGEAVVIVFVEVTVAQLPLPVAVKVNVLLPAVISAALGAYVAAVSEFGLARVPPTPFDVQVIVL